MSFCTVNDLQPASFRGTPFWVKNDKEGYGRRIVTHEYPMRDDPYNEDMGEKAQKFSITGYVFGESATADKEAVVAACRARGSALLQLPAKQAFNAVCNSLSVARNKDEIGIFDLTMEFTADPAAGGMPMMVGMAEALISGIDFVTPLVGVYTDLFTSDNVLPFVTANATARIQAFASAIVGATETAIGAALNSATTPAAPGPAISPLLQTLAALPTIVAAPVTVTAAPATQVLNSAMGLVQNASALCRPGPADPPASTIVGTMAAMFGQMFQAMSLGDAVTTFKDLATFTSLEPTDDTGQAQYNVQSFIEAPGPAANKVNATAPQSPSAVADAANAAVFNGTVRTIALISYAQALSSYNFSTRSDAVQARADLVELTDQQLERTTDEAVTQALITARDYAVVAMSKNTINAIPVISVSAGISLPCLYWAGRLYNDATRAEQLVLRNNIPTSAFMPSTFEALSQ